MTAIKPTAGSTGISGRGNVGDGDPPVPSPDESMAKIGNDGKKGDAEMAENLGDVSKGLNTAATVVDTTATLVQNIPYVGGAIAAGMKVASTAVKVGATVASVAASAKAGDTAGAIASGVTGAASTVGSVYGQATAEASSDAPKTPETETT